MCIIAVCKKAALDKKTFATCFRKNDDGVGFAWSDGKKVHFKKGFMKLEDAWDAYEGLSVPHVVHFRLASVGGVQPDLTHPFLCSLASELVLDWTGSEHVLFHNGSLGEWKSILLCAQFTNKVIPKGAMSDTRALAVGVGTLGIDFLLQWSGKFAVVTPTDIITIGEFEEDAGTLYSNAGYKDAWLPATRTYWSNDNSLPVDVDTCKECEFYYDEILSDNTLALFCQKRKVAMDNTRKCFQFKASGEVASNLKTCPLCYHEAGSYCTLTRKRLVDEKPCKEWRHFQDLPTGRGRKKKAAAIKALGIDKVIDIGGARIIDGEVEDNFLDRLKNLQ